MCERLKSFMIKDNNNKINDLILVGISPLVVYIKI